MCIMYEGWGVLCMKGPCVLCMRGGEGKVHVYEEWEGKVHVYYVRGGRERPMCIMYVCIMYEGWGGKGPCVLCEWEGKVPCVLCVRGEWEGKVHVYCVRGGEGKVHVYYLCVHDLTLCVRRERKRLAAM